MIYNEGGLEIFYSENRDPIEVPPRFVAEVRNQQLPRKVKRISSVHNLMTTAKRVVFFRSYRLGDILMLLPVARQFKKFYGVDHLTLIAYTPFAEQVSLFNDGAFDHISTDIRCLANEYDIGFLLNGVVERDHSDPSLQTKPRITIYQEFLGLPTDQELDWGNLADFQNPSGAVFCSGGSNRNKKLPSGLAEYVAYYLRRRFSKFLHVHENCQISTKQLLDAIRVARVVVTMDTAPLWIAHFTKTPTVLITGPTRGKERLAHHPLRPDGVAEVDLAQEIICKPCFEKSTSCSGRVDCLNRVSAARLWELVEAAVESVAWKTRELNA